MKKKKGFTLIELISVLVILAILALIVTPLVLNIIKKARTAADKRSIDAYGRSIELAIADYLLDNGSFLTSIDELQVEYTGDKVECATTTLKEDGSVYLASCTVAGRSVEGYTYGKGEEEPTPITYQSYSIGDEVTYNNVNYYVIADSDETNSSVTLLKVEPLTYEEVQMYSAGTEAPIGNQNGYGGMKYHSSSNNYETSYVKTTVDAWKIENAPVASQARLITFDELKDNLGYTYGELGTMMKWHSGEATPNWAYANNYMYWTMTQHSNSSTSLWAVAYDGAYNISTITNTDVRNSNLVIRPVIVISKSALN